MPWCVRLDVPAFAYQVMERRGKKRRFYSNNRLQMERVYSQMGSFVKAPSLTPTFGACSPLTSICLRNRLELFVRHLWLEVADAVKRGLPLTHIYNFMLVNPQICRGPKEFDISRMPEA